MTSEPFPLREPLLDDVTIKSPIWIRWFNLVSTRIAGSFNQVMASSYSLSDLNTAPANAGDTGTKGEIRIDATHIYVCVATNTWKRAAIVTWP